MFQERYFVKYLAETWRDDETLNTIENKLNITINEEYSVVRGHNYIVPTRI